MQTENNIANTSSITKISDSRNAATERLAIVSSAWFRRMLGPPCLLSATPQRTLDPHHGTSPRPG